MKTLFSTFKPLMLLIAAVATLTLVSCDKNDEDITNVKEDIVGIWDVTSYKVDGDEYIGFAIEAAAMQFNAYTGDEGVFDQEVKFFDEEEILSISGAYSVNESKDQVSMNYEGDIVTAKVRFMDNGNQLRWDGTQDGYPLIILATRR